MTQEEIQIAQAAYCVGKMWDEYEGTEDFDRMVGKRVQHLIELVRNHLEMEQPKVDLDKELQAFLCNYDYEFDDDAPAYDIARHFYELGQCEMRNRITNPEYNKQVVERIKFEHPIAASEEKLKKAIKERYPMPEDADAHTRDRIAAARNGFLSGYSYELGRKEGK